VYFLNPTIIMGFMEKEKLTKIATYYFKKMRTIATFLHIAQIEQQEDVYKFYGCFQGKKKRMCKQIYLDKNGNIVKES
jgi:hypothetical protein